MQARDTALTQPSGSPDPGQNTVTHPKPNTGSSSEGATRVEFIDSVMQIQVVINLQGARANLGVTECRAYECSSSVRTEVILSHCGSAWN